MSWSQEKLPEREELSDEELSDEEDVSDEEFVVPRKRKLKNEDVVNKRIKPDGNPSANLLKIPKKQEPRPMLIKSTRKRPLAPAVPPRPPGKPPKRLKPSVVKPSEIPSRR